MKRLFLIDGMAVLFRGYFALLNAGLRSKSGEPTGATFAFITTLERLLETEKPDLIAIAWDSAGPTFRHDHFDQYKANRPDFPDDLGPQLQRVMELVDYYHIPSVRLQGYEADDIIGTLARKAESEGYRTYCVTPDKDYMQLVNDQTFVYRPTKPGQGVDIVDTAGVHEKFGVRPDQVIDVLALMGDSSDNVPGVKGIGEKTAIPLIQQFGSVEELYERLDEVEKKGVRSKLENDRENAFLSKQLVTIHLDVPIDTSLDNFHLDPPDVSNLVRLFDELGFTSLIKRYQNEDGEIVATSPSSESGTTPSDSKSNATGEGNAAQNNAEDGNSTAESSAPATVRTVRTISDCDHSYTLVDTEEKLDELIRTVLEPAPLLCFDTETDSTDEHIAQLIGFSFAVEPTTAYYVPVRARKRVEKPESSSNGSLFDDEPEQEEEPIESSGMDINVVAAKLKPVLENRAILKVAQNGKYDMLVLRRYGIDVDPLHFDTMLAAYVIDSSTSVGMDALAERYLGYRPVSITELIGPKGKGQKTLLEIPVEKVSEYACEDADVTLQLYSVLNDELEKENLKEIAEVFEFPLVSVLTEMEYTGIYVDTVALKQISEQLSDTMESLEQEIYSIAGHPFTINSPKQLSEVLFTELELPPQKKTKTGYSTDQFVLEELSILHPLPEKVLEYRQAAKLKSTYVDALPAMINARTGRVHTSYNQAVTSTGRLSSNNPNLQNIPIRSEIGREIRKAFVAGFDDGVLLSADYSQIELRIMAHVCGDEALIQAFEQEMDIHTSTAMRVFNVPADQVEGNMRRKAKEVNFGIMYGIGPFGLARRLKIEQSEARELIDTYFRNYPGVQNYINGILQQLRETGYVETISGRRRYFGNPDKLRNPQRGMVERAAINMPIQGTAADIIKLAMITIHRELPEAFPEAKMLLQVHDELVFEVPRHQAEELASFVKDRMENAFSLGRTPLIVETGIGENWFEAH